MSPRLLPLQCGHEARQLLLTGEHRTSDAAFIVGYESTSPFNREYLRQFGAPPGRDMQQIREAIDISTRTNRHG
ncbi:AraC family transcriptional regulator [Serratia sp. root2]|uniref:AraC family transcriptional regulator n=1 Tax=Serratia sp. root2 TaxID=3059676 RepID=UPI002ED5D2CB